MAERFLQLNLDNEALEADELAVSHPNAFILLYFIARRARRFAGHSDGLEPGMAKIGDWENMGLSRQNYRTALKVLVVKRFLQIIETNRNRKKSTTGSTTEGTLVKLLDSRIWDINIETPNHRSNHCLTTAQPLPNHEQERIRKNKNEKEEQQNIAQPASRLRTKDVLVFNFSSFQFEGISPEDTKAWNALYPHITLDVELSKASEWLKSNPSKSGKKLWRKFITGWFQRSNDSIENKKAYQNLQMQGVQNGRNNQRSAFNNSNSTSHRQTKERDGTPVDISKYQW